MPTNQSNTYMRIRKISRWIWSKAKRNNNAAGVILPTGESYYLLHGQQITNEEFDQIFPLKEPVQNINRYGSKLDSRQITD
jgi:hypothetical protein